MRLLYFFALAIASPCLGQGEELAYSLEEALQRPEKIKVLFLAEVQDFPAELLQLKNLEVLTVQSCNFPFPETVGCLKNLSRINITSSKTYPNGLFYFPNLTEMHLSHNEFDSISPSEARKLNLEKLMFNGLHNPGEVIPQNWHLIAVDSIEFAFIDNLEQLKEIVLSPRISYVKIFESKATTLPEFFFQIKTLRTFIVEGIKIKELILSENYSIEEFILKSTHINCVPFEKLRFFKRVELETAKMSEDCKKSALNYSNIILK